MTFTVKVLQINNVYSEKLDAFMSQQWSILQIGKTFHKVIRCLDIRHNGCCLSAVQNKIAIIFSKDIYESEK